MKKTITFVLAFLVIALATPLPLHAAFEEAGRNNESNREQDVDRTEQNSKATEEQSIKATESGSGSGTGSGITDDDDTSLQDDGSGNEIKSISPSVIQNQSQRLSLKDFETALDKNPSAERLVLRQETGGSISIEPGTKTAGTREEILRAENLEIIDALRDALEEAYSAATRGIVGQVISQNNLLSSANSHLSAARLREILNRARALGTSGQTARTSAFTLPSQGAFFRSAVLNPSSVGAQQYAFTLQHFRNALAHPSNKGAERLIIRGSGVSAMIVAAEKKDSSADTIIRKALKRALENEGHHKNFVHELTSQVLSYSSMLEKLRKIRPPLSFEKLKLILQRADDAMAEKKLLQATRSIAPLPAKGANRGAARKVVQLSVEKIFNKVGLHHERFEKLAAQIAARLVEKNQEEVAAEHALETAREASERQEIENLLRIIIHRFREPEIFQEQYHESEAAAVASKAAHNQAMKARKDVEEKEKYLTQARDCFEKIKTALDEKRNLAEFEESTLNKIAQTATIASAVLGVVNVPFINAQGIADAISTFATFADAKWSKTEAQQAYNKLQAAIREEEAATQGNEQLDEAVHEIHAHAKELERTAQEKDHQETMRLAKTVTPPIDFLKEEEWRQWASALASKTDAENEEEAVTTAYLFYKHGKKNPEIIHDLVSKLWEERMTRSEAEFKHLATKTPQSLQQRDQEYQRAKEKEIQAEAEAVSARARLEAASEAKIQWLSKREALRSETRNLENQLLTDPAEREKWQSELNAKHDEMALHQTQKKNIDANYQTAVAEATTLTAAAREAREDAFEKFKIYNSAKESHERNHTRIAAAAQVDREAFSFMLIARDQRKAAQARKAANGAFVKEKAALARGGKKTAELQRQIACALGGDYENPGVAYFYTQAVESQAKGDVKAAEAWRKSAQAYEAQTATLIPQIETLSQGDEKAFELHKTMIGVLRGLAYAYNKVAKSQAEGSVEIAEDWCKSVQVLEAQAETLSRGEEKVLELENQIASSLKDCSWNIGAAGVYVQAVESQSKGDVKAAEAWRKRAQALEAQAEGLSRGDEKAIRIQEQVVSAFETTWIGRAYNRIIKR